MSEAGNSLLLRFARWQVRALVRVWPEESRRWGQALASEAEEIEQPLQAIRWALGGVTVYLRSVGSHAMSWLKSPVGNRSSAGIAPLSNGPGPKRSRLFTAAVLVSAAALLCIPEGREALRTVSASWRGFTLTTFDQWTLQRLATNAEQERDSQTLAFIALSPTEDAKRASELVERTVTLDSSLIWIYGATNHHADYYPVQQSWLERLQAADPDNAVPLLLEANARADQIMRATSQPGARPEDDSEKLARDAQWMALMERAYAAPRYDSYFQKHFQLMRHVWDKNPNLPPEIFLMGLWSHTFPNLRPLKMYADIEIREAKNAEAVGDLKQAEKLASHVEGFGRRVTDPGAPTLETLIGMTISRSAALALAEIYATEGMTIEARAANMRVQQIDQSMHDRKDDPERRARADSLRKKAFLVQSFGIVGLVAGIASLAAILLLEQRLAPARSSKRLWRRALCLAADWAPGTLLLASGAFLVCFLPFQRALAEFRASSFQLVDGQRLTDALWSLLAVPSYMLGDDEGLTFWTTLTVVLSAVVAVMLARMALRAKRASAAQS